MEEHKPQFFIPIFPGSSSANPLPIPAAFQRDYLVGREDSEGVATLKSNKYLTKSWKVKLNGFRFGDGWADFYKAHELRLGDFMFFEYEGSDLSFHVGVFDSSYCEVEYPTPTPVCEVLDTSAAEGSNRRKSKGNGKGQRKCKGIGKKKQALADDINATPEESGDFYEHDSIREDRISSISKYPHFVATMKSYNIDAYFLLIPAKFTKQYIPDEAKYVILKDEEGERWPIKLNRQVKYPTDVRFGAGWKKFIDDKRLKTGDICLYEQENEDEMEFKVSIVRK